MTTKKTRTRNRIKRGAALNNTMETASNEHEIVSQMQEINLHLKQITNAIRACCNSNSNTVNQAPNSNEDTVYPHVNALE